MERVMVFIDLNNFSAAANELNAQNGQAVPIIDFGRLAVELCASSRLLLKTFIYTALSDRSDNPTVYDNQSRFIDALKHKPRTEVVVGYLSKKAIPGVTLDPANPRTYVHVEKETDVNIAKDILIKAFYNSYDTAVLLSGDRDYIPIMRSIKEMGKNTEIALVTGQRSPLDNIVDTVTRIDLDMLNRCKRQ